MNFETDDVTDGFSGFGIQYTLRIGSRAIEVTQKPVDDIAWASLDPAPALPPHSQPEFAALIRRDYDKYGKLVREIGVRAD